MTDDLNELQSRIQQARETSLPDKNAKAPNDSEGTNTGIRAVTDLIATPIVCVAAPMRSHPNSPVDRTVTKRTMQA